MQTDWHPLWYSYHITFASNDVTKPTFPDGRGGAGGEADEVEGRSLIETS